MSLTVARIIWDGDFGWGVPELLGETFMVTGMGASRLCCRPEAAPVHVPRGERGALTTRRAEKETAPKNKKEIRLSLIREFVV